MTTSTSMTETDRRAEYVAGLRAIADMLEQHQDVPLPPGQIQWPVHHWAGTPTEHKTVMATIARALPCTLAKNDPTKGQYDAAYFTLTGRVGGVPVEVWAQRDTVCRRVVTGTQEVVKTVATATEEVTVVEDIVEWVCSPVLAAVTS